MHTSGPDRLITIEEYARLPETQERVELLRGRLVREPRPTYGHGALQARLAHLLTRHIEQHGLPLICGTDFGCQLSRSPDSLLAPDVAVARLERASPGDPGFFPGAPDLVVEIVSPSNTAIELQEKVLEYLDAGTALVWIIYPERRLIVVHPSRTEAHLLSASNVLDGGDVLPGFQVLISDLFTW